MELRYWLAAFRALHERSRKGDLSAAERAQYLSQREELARALVAAQRLILVPGQTARQALRVARALQVDLDLIEGRARLMTMHLSSGGFGALLSRAPELHTSIGFSLKAPGGNEPVVGQARVVDVQKRTGNHFVSFSFVDLGAADQERLELALFDTVLQQFEGMAF